MNRKNRAARIANARAHQKQMKERRAEALSESIAAAKKAKKGKKGIIAQMTRRGYRYDPETGAIKRMTKGERARKGVVL